MLVSRFPLVSFLKQPHETLVGKGTTLVVPPNALMTSSIDFGTPFCSEWAIYDCFSQRLQEIDQILHLLVSQPYLKTLVVEIHHLRKVRRRAVMEVRCSRRESS